MELLLSILYTATFLWLIYKLPFFKLKGLPIYAVPTVFILKVLAGTALYLIYTIYYKDRSTADIFKYFDDSAVMYHALFTHPLDYIKMLIGVGNDSQYFDAHYYNYMNNWYRQYESTIYNDNHTIIRFNALVRVFSFGFYGVHNVFMNFCSLLGFTALYRFFTKYIPNKEWIVFIAVFLLPSVLFWGSGVLKEGLLMLGLSMLLYHFDQYLTKQKKTKHLVFTLLSFVLLVYIKVYILLTVIPLLVAYTWVFKTNHRYAFGKYTVVLFLCTLASLGLKYIKPEYNILQLLTQKQIDFINVAHAMDAGSLIDVKILQPDVLSFLSALPTALFTTLFRPFPLESFSPFMLLSEIENLLVVIGILASIFFLRRGNLATNLLCLSFFFVLITFVLTGLTTPVLGAVVRYKVPALPFLFIIFIMLVDETKLPWNKNKSQI